MDIEDITHQKVFSILKNEPPGRLLDAGAGGGDLSLAFKKAGFDVVACDIVPKRLKKLTIGKADLNRKLPFSDSSFNYITCVEVLEHLKNPYFTVKEFYRILKSGGLLIITTPNISNVFSRIKFFFTGKFFLFSLEERKSGHISPLTDWQLEYILKDNGFSIQRITSNAYFMLSGDGVCLSRIKRIFARLAYYMFYLFLKPRNPDILKGDLLIFVARK